jgi:tetratricopeptide (TPR) repeat protein
MSKYNLEINYLVSGFDISTEELLEIIEEADRVLAKTTENPQKTAEAYLKKSQCLQKLGKYTESRAPIEKALFLFPDMVEAIVQLGNIYKEEKNYDEAITAYNRAIHINPGYAAAFTNRGNVYHSKGEQEKAIADYTETIRLRPDNAIAFYNRANAYEKQGAYVKARVDWDEAIRLCPGLNELQKIIILPPIMWYNISEDIPTDKWSDNKDIVNLTETLFLQPEAVFFYNRACIYVIYNEYIRALADYTDAIRLNPDYTDAFINRGNVYIAKDDCDKAIADYTEAVRLNPADRETFKRRGAAYKALGQHNKVIADYTEAIRLGPDDQWVFVERGTAYEALGQHDKAIADYTEAIRLGPDNQWIFEKRGAAYEALGQHDKAKADRDEVTRLKQKLEQDYPGFFVSLKYDDLMHNIDRYVLQDIDEIITENREQPEKLAAVYLKESLRSFLVEDDRKGVEFLAKALDIYSCMDQAKVRQLKSEFLSDFTSGISETLNSFDKAITEWTELMERHPEKFGQFLNNRGTTYAKKAGYYKAIARWIGAIGVEPEAGACFQTYTRDYDQAVADYTEAIKSNSLNPGGLGSIYQNRGNLYADWGDYDKAIADYSEAIRLNSDDAHYCYFRQGIVYDILDNYDQAITAYTEAIRLAHKEDPQPMYFYNRGIVYDEKNEYEKAIADYTRAINIGIFCETEALHNRCLAYKATGQHEKAAADFAKLKSQFPKYEEAAYRHGRDKSSWDTVL